MRKYIFWLVVVVWIGLDLWSKSFASEYLQDRVDLLGDFLYLEHVFNDGIAFSVDLNQMLLKIVTIFLIIWFFYYYWLEERKKKSLCIDISFWLIIWGAIWNWIERIFRENVVDFIGVKYFSVFNLADSFITVGAVLYLIALLKYKGLEINN